MINSVSHTTKGSSTFIMPRKTKQKKNWLVFLANHHQRKFIHKKKTNKKHTRINIIYSRALSIHLIVGGFSSRILVQFVLQHSTIPSLGRVCIMYKQKVNRIHGENFQEI